jgi:DNA-binding transcriptional LysR family regulator
MSSRLEDLELLAAVIEHGTFTAAASHLGTTQSRVSRAISRLESGLGVVLVRRSPRRVSATAAGRHLAQHTNHMLRELASVEATLRSSDGMSGPLAISTPPSLGRRLLGPSIAKFCKEQPGVQLDWSLGARRVDLIAEEVDVAVRVGPLAPTWERARRIICGAYHVYAAPGFANDASLPADLPSLDCLGLHVTHRRDQWPFVVDGKLHWLRLEPIHWTDDVDALIGMTVSGLGVAMLPDFLVAQEAASGALVRLTDPHSVVPADVFANLGFQQPTARAAALVEHLMEATVAMRP